MNAQVLERTTDKNKTHINKDMSFTSLLDTYKPALHTQITHNQLTELKELLTNELIAPDSVLYVDANFTIQSGQLKSDIVQADQIALVLHNNQNDPVSMACYSHDNASPLITNPSVPCAFVLGDLSRDIQTWCIDNIEHGIKLYKAFTSYNIDVNVLVSINRYHFKDMVNHFAEVSEINITTTLTNKNKLLKQFAGVRGNAVITELIPLYDCDSYADADLTELLTDDTTQTIDLTLLGWGEPESLANEPSKPTPYPIEAFTGVLRNTVEKIAYYAQVPHAMDGQCVLGALAHIGQRFVNAPMGHTHMPASLYLVTEGESGSGKSMALKLSHNEINAHEQEQYQIYIAQLDDWQNDKASLKGSELKEFLATTPQPTNPITMFKDATIEPILDKFINDDICNASWTTDEAGQFFNGHTMKGDTAGSALGSFTQLHSDGSVSRYRSQKSQYANPKTQAYKVRMTLLLMGQRVVLEKALTDPLMNGQGFLARCLIACPSSLQGNRVWNDAKRRQQNPYFDPDLKAYWQRCKQLLDPAPNNDPEYSKKDRLNIAWESKEAEQVFYDGMQRIENLQAKGMTYEHLKAYASRMAENASRIATLMAYFENRTSITTDDIKRAFMLVEYSTAERLRYLDAGTSEQTDSEKLSEWLVKKTKCKTPPIINRTNVYNGCPKPMLKNNKLLQKELDNLESMGHIKQVIDGKTKLIYINPKLTE